MVFFSLDATIFVRLVPCHQLYSCIDRFVNLYLQTKSRRSTAEEIRFVCRYWCCFQVAVTIKQRQKTTNRTNFQWSRDVAERPSYLNCFDQPPFKGWACSVLAIESESGVTMPRLLRSVSHKCPWERYKSISPLFSYASKSRTAMIGNHSRERITINLK